MPDEITPGSVGESRPTHSPLLGTLTSSARIAEEIFSSSVRFLMFRTARRDWCLGKFLGHAFLVLPQIVHFPPHRHRARSLGQAA